MSTFHSMPGHLIRRLHQISTSIFQDRMKAEGLDLTSIQFATLTVLRDHPGIDQATLAGLVAIDRPTLGGVAERLEAKGLIARKVSDRDRRARELRITAAGLALLDRITPIVAALQDDILTGLSDGERGMFLRLAEKAVEAGNRLSRAPKISEPG